MINFNRGLIRWPTGDININASSENKYASSENIYTSTLENIDASEFENI